MRDPLAVESPVALTSPPGSRLSYREALVPPCLSCPTSPCCNYLNLQSVRLETLIDVDHAVYLLNFTGIVFELDLAKDELRVYLHQPCRHLDGASGLCRVHGTTAQPSICTHYDAHACGYRASMTRDVNPGTPRLDRRRMDWYVEHLEFDDDRRIVGRPAEDETLEAFRAMPLELDPLAPPASSEWRPVVLSPEPSGPRRYTDPVVTDPCGGCEAYCCQTLLFPRTPPRHAADLDVLRYAVGFPGVEVAVADEGWALVVRTTCRHLDGNRCSVYGTDERPLKCSYYDALRCTYRANFGGARTESIVRVTYEEFDVLAESVLFDGNGQVAAVPSAEALRGLLDGNVPAPDRVG